MRLVVQAQDDQHDPQVCTLSGVARHEYLFDYTIELWKANDEKIEDALSEKKEENSIKKCLPKCEMT